LRFRPKLEAHLLEGEKVEQIGYEYYFVATQKRYDSYKKRLRLRAIHEADIMNDERYNKKSSTTLWTIVEELEEAERLCSQVGLIKDYPDLTLVELFQKAMVYIGVTCQELDDEAFRFLIAEDCRPPLMSRNGERLTKKDCIELLGVRRQKIRTHRVRLNIRHLEDNLQYIFMYRLREWLKRGDIPSTTPIPWRLFRALYQGDYCKHDGVNRKRPRDEYEPRAHCVYVTYIIPDGPPFIDEDGKEIVMVNGWPLQVIQ
jgi:hypothetical protein